MHVSKPLALFALFLLTSGPIARAGVGCITLGTTCSYDVDGNGAIDGNDGMVILRRLFGFEGAALTDGLILSPGARTPEEVEQTVANVVEKGLADVNRDGASQPLVDGILLQRYIAGYRGNRLVKDLAIPSRFKGSAAAYASFVEGVIPQLYLRY